MGIADFDPGEMSARLTLQAPADAPDGQGGAIAGFSDVAGLWARIVPLTASAEERAGAEAVTVTHNVWVRYRADLAAGMRLVKGGRVFAIRTVRDPDETGRYLLCQCTEEGR